MYSLQKEKLVNPKTTVARHKKISGLAATFIGCFLFFLIMRQFQK